MIADSRGCLRFLPYAHNRDGENYFTVKVRATPHEPAKFDIYELTPETAERSKLFEPPLLSTLGMLINCDSGKLYCKEYPSLQLYLDESEIPNYAMGDFVSGYFKRKDVDDPTDHRYVSVHVENNANSKLICKKLYENYGLVSIFCFRGRTEFSRREF